MIRTALIAVFWADIDTRGIGEVFYRQTNESYSVANVTESIREAFESADDFVPTTLFIATWKSVGYFDRNTDQTNTFQCVLATNGNMSYVFLLYADLQWTAAESCNGADGGSGSDSENGCAISAQVGFSAGDMGLRFFALNGSGTEDVLQLNSTSNVNRPGVWIFQVDGHSAVSGDLNECLSDPCNVNANCANIPGSFTCTCIPGYTGDGLNCTNVNECEHDGLNNCHDNANCIDTEGSFICSCSPDYTGDGVNCTNINECELEVYPCHSNANCTDTDGSFNCTCVVGFEGNGFNCTDIPECDRALDDCDMNATCTNTFGSYDCMCNTGFTGNGFTCTDVDECVTGMDDCHVNATCSNTFGSFECTCVAGYEGNGVNCTNINECESEMANDCDVNADCTDTVGSYDCSCSSGYEGDGFNCTDINECEWGTDVCVNAECNNTVGSYTCRPCFPGFIPENMTTCTCENGDLRLMNGTEPSEREGRVEICYNNIYGTVCDDQWDIVDAGVVCRQLGFNRSEGPVAIGGAYFGNGTGDILLDNVVCRGTESSLIACSTNAVGQHNCDHSEDAGVRCEATCTDGDLRLLVGGGTTFYQNENTYSDHYFIKDQLARGRVEVCMSGTYGTVCDDSWDDQDASVVCRQLGFSPNGAIPVTSGIFSDTSQSPTVSHFQCNGSEADLLSCSYSISVDNSSCSLPDDAGVVCQGISTPASNCTNGDLKLVGGASLAEGRVEICINNAWGTVCDDGFTKEEAVVVCRQLGLLQTEGGAQALSGSEFSHGTGPIFLDRLGCSGTEDSLLDCDRFAGLGLHSCDHSQDAGVNCTDIDECITDNGGCDHYCTNTIGSFECSCYSGYTLAGDGHTCLDLETCSTEGAIRLVNGTSATEGTVEVCIGGRYGTVCDDRWGELDARVVCRYLGYSGEAVPLKQAFFGGSPSRPIHLDNVRCNGSESSLLSCASNPVGMNNCDHSEDAGVKCTGPLCIEGSVRLLVGEDSDYYTGDTNYDDAYYIKDQLARGRVEVCVGGRYGTVCDDSWDNQDASVVCRQLGFSPHGAIAVNTGSFSENSLSHLLSDVDCQGSEANLLQCQYSTTTSCGPTEDAAAVCQAASTPDGNCSDGDLRLLGASDSTQLGTRDGRVEICINNAWGTICNTLFGREDAEVVCEQLEGFQRDGAEVLPGAQFGSAMCPIFLDQLVCSGSETSLLECQSYTPLGLSTCQHSQDVGVRCVDVDECATSNGGCEQICNNTIGSFYCSCDTGYQLDGNGLNCTDINECESNIESCLANATCTNTEGSFICSCDPGYTGDGVNCTNFDECQMEIYPCNANANCSDTIGSFTCTCIDGFEGLNCSDIHECDRELDECDPNASCNNTFGSYNCVCNTGFTGNGFACTDIDECVIEMDNCHVNATCNNTFGSFECACDAGFEGNGVNCTNIDECELETDNCHVNATCADVIGSFDCTCNSGFEGDGVNCTNINECEINGLSGCDGNANCIDTTGSYDCVCNSGYEGDGFNCTDINECEQGTHACVNAECNNTAGNYTCSPCFPGFSPMDPTSCTCTNGDIRLIVNGTEPSLREGRVEICYNNAYGTVCDDRWDMVDAGVVCSQLGFNRSGSVALTGAHFGSGSGDILLDNVVCQGNESTLLECDTNPVGQHDCDHSEDAGVRCGVSCTDGDVSLQVSGVTTFRQSNYDLINDQLARGRVEVCIGGTYVTVCDDIWDNQDASVVCRQLGFSSSGAIAVTSGIFSDNSQSPTIGHFQCRGSETNLLSCSHSNSIDNSTCSHSYDAGVVCQSISTFADNCTDGDLRLVDGANLAEGRVEICINNAWGTVCDDGFTKDEAVVVCRQLGLLQIEDGAQVLSGSEFGHCTGPIFLDRLGCSGTEDSLLDCDRFAGLGLHSCDHSQDAGVNCTDIDECATNSSGCDHHCTNTVGSFVCSCYPEYTLAGDGRTCLDLDTCSVEGAIRLVNGTSATEGTVEVCIGGRYGTVCDDRWDELDARVVCRYLGYSGEAVPLKQALLGSSPSRAIHLDNVRCNGSESSLLSCASNPVGVNNCDHSEDAGVKCNAFCIEGSVRLLVGEDSDYYTGDTNYDEAYYIKDQLARGRVEVCAGGRYGTVCDDSWDNQDATVVCRQLGFSPFGAIAVTTGFRVFLQSDLPHLLTDVDCQGSEANLLQCQYSTTISCGPTEVAAAVCQAVSTPAGNCSDGDLRLEGFIDNMQEGTREGRVEVCINNAWGTVCSNIFRREDAEVVCERLVGFQMDGANALSEAQFGSAIGPIFLDQLDCSGSETSLLECRYYTALGLSTCQHSEDAGVRCIDVNECITDNGNCEQNCTNTIGSFYCSCWTGYRLDENWKNCTDINECDGNEDNCHEYANCTNTEGSFTCSCNPGYTGDGVNCTNINECELEIYPCHSNANCTDTDGSFNCTCVVGFEGDGFNCTDIHECDRRLDECDMNATCINTVGSYDCLCNTGFTGNGFSCEDIEECVTGMDDCHVNATCNNTFGSFECTCDAGFEGNGVNCTNIDECALDTDNCHVNATCADVIGSFVCTCNTGFEGDGVNCTNINECVRGTHQCDMNGNCTDNIGSYDCRCNTGYMGDGFYCEDIDECNETNPIHNCDINADCINTDGSFNCTCHFGYTGDGVSCTCSNGRVQLMNGTQPTVGQREGRVEVCIDNMYGTICDDFWDALEAKVVCQKLGFSPNASVPVSRAVYGSGIGSIFLDDLLCEGTESSLLECPTRNDGLHNCNHSEDAGVQCEANCTDGTIRLVVGEDYEYYMAETNYDQAYYIDDKLSHGRVEICKGGEYHTICADLWDESDASVVCRELGFSPNGATAIGSGYFSTSALTPALAEVQCTGSEASLNDCPSIPVTECSSTNDAAVVCQDSPAANCLQGELRLAGGQFADLEGRVEICINNAWGTICDTRFNSEAAQVVCRQLGHPSEGAVAHQRSFYGPGSGPVFLDQVRCSGNEVNLTSCSYLPLGLPSVMCTHSDDAGVECPDTNQCEGSEEVCAVNATCINVRGPYNCECKPGFEGNGFINCSDIDECDTNNGGCHHCINTIGSYECDCQSGFEVLRDGINKTCVDVDECDNGTKCGENADCVNFVGSFNCSCREGYDGNATVQCENIDECAEDTHGCSPYAYCTDTIGGYLCDCQFGYTGDGFRCNCTDGQVRLMNGTLPSNNQTEGRVEICYNNTYGTVCDDFWDELDAAVVCRQLGFNGSDHVALKSGSEFFGSGFDPIWFDNSICNGTESSLLECSTNPIGEHNCNHSEDAGVRCNALCDEGSVRLLPGVPPREYYADPTRYALIKDELSIGRVEVCIAGKYGTVCDDSWSNKGASVVCKQLGFSPYGAIAVDSLFSDASLPTVLSLVNCTGREDTLITCPSSNDTQCGQFDDAGVVCQAHTTSFANCTDGEVRLIRDGEVTAFEGRVEVCINNAWGTVCNELFDSLEARVICGQLGFERHRNHRLKSFGLGTGPIYLSRLDCQGSEANLLECRTDARATGVHDCSHSHDVGVQCEAQCIAEEEHSIFYGSYLWPANTPLEDTVQRSCNYSCGSFTDGNATRYCTGRGLWNSTNFSECPTKRTCDLIAFANEPISPETVDMAAADLRAIINASGSEDHSTGNLELVAMTFGAISRLDHTISDEEATNIIETVDALQSWNSEVLQEDSSQIVESFEVILTKLVQKDDFTDLSVSTPNLTFEGKKVGINDARSSGIMFMPSIGEQTTEGNMSISLPPALFNSINTGNVRVSFTAYTTAALFPLASDPSRSDRFELGSPVIGANLNGVSSLSNNVTIELPMRNENFKVPTCMYWNFTAEGGRGDWSSDGCSVAGTRGLTITCTCNHLTNFGVIANTNPVSCNENTHSPSDDFSECIARRPDVQVEVNTNITHANAYYEKRGNIYSVGIGQEFGLVCTTSSFFEVYWYHGDMRVQEISSERPSLPVDEEAGHLYAYRISQYSVVLKTLRAVGIQWVAAGTYTCVAENGDERNTSTVTVEPKDFVSTNGTSYVRFNTAPKEDIQRTLNFVSEEFVDVYFSTQILNELNNHMNGRASAMCYNVSRRLDEESSVERSECRISSEVMYSGILNIVNGTLESVQIDDSRESNAGFCDAEVNIDTPHGVYNWSETEVGMNDTNVCVYNTTKEHANGMARRHCASPGQWDAYYGGQCITRLTFRIQSLLDQPITADNINMIVGELTNIVNQISDPADQSPDNLNVIATVFIHTTSLIESGSISVNDNFTVNTVEILDGITDWPPNVLKQNSSGIVSSFEDITENLVGQVNFTTITVSRDALAFMGERVDREVLQENGLIFDPTTISLTEEMQPSSESSDSEYSTSTTDTTSKISTPAFHNFSLQLPGEVFTNLTEDRIGLSYFLYDTASLFPVAPDSEERNFSVASPVIGVAVNGENITNLDSPVIISLPITSADRENYTRLSPTVCVTWNFTAGERGNWSETGCEVADIDEESGVVVCHCNHLTNFAVLVNIQARTGQPPPPQTPLSVLTYVGAILSMIGLILTAITLVASKKLRPRDVTKLHFQLCIALFCLLLVFMVGIDRNENEVVCTAMSALIQYFTLAAVLWMGAEAVLMFQKLIIVFGNITVKYFVIVSLICWLSPLVAVVSSLATLATGRNTLIFVVNEAENRMIETCFISDTIVFFTTFLAPILVVIIFNTVMFILAVGVMITSARKRKMSIKSTVKTMVGIMGLMVLFGLTWLFGALTVREASIVFQYLFVISNAFQGFFFFVFICILGKEGRKFWIGVFRKNTKSHSIKTSQNQFGTNLRTPTSPFGTLNPNFAHQLSANNCSESGDLNSEHNLKNGKATEDSTVFINQEALSKESLIQGVKDSLPKTSTNMDSHKDQVDLELGKSDLDIESNIETSNIKQTEFTDGVGAVVIAQDEGVVEGDIPIVGSIFDHKFEEVGLGWQTVVPSNEDGAESTNGCEFDVGTSL